MTYKNISRWVMGCLVWAAAPANAQPAGWDNLPDQFTRYQVNAFQEKVFVHTDKDFYLAGETLWFKVYEVDACFNRQMPTSGVAYLELVGSDRQPVLRAEIRVKNGSGAGAWTLPAGIATGNYILRAYTSWMKNFPPDFYFHQPITIVNTLNPSGIDTVRSTAGYDLQFFPEGGHLVEGLPSRVAFKAVNQDGDGVACAGVVLNEKKDTIVHWRSARFGMGSFVFTPRKGERYAALVTTVIIPGTTVSIPGTAASVPARLGAISGTPASVPGTTGSIPGTTGSIPGTTGSIPGTPASAPPSVPGTGAPGVATPKTVELPSVDPRGYTLQLDEGDKDRIKIIVRSNMEDRQVYLFTHTRGLYKNFQAAYLANGAAVFFIDRKSLGDGISQITLFNAEKMPVCERLFFKMPESVLHIGVKNLSAGYRTRQKIDLSLLTTDGAGHPAPGDCSMSVFLLDSLQSVPCQTILSYLLLTSDLRGKIECPSCYFGDRAVAGASGSLNAGASGSLTAGASGSLNAGASGSPTAGNSGSGSTASASTGATTSDLDNLLLTQGWTRFRWDDILGGNDRPKFEYIPETNGPVISGKVINRHTGLAAPSVIAYLSIPGRYFDFSAAMSHTGGNIFFSAGNWIGNKEMIVQTNSRTDSNYRVDINNPFSDKFSADPLQGFALSRKWEPLLTERSIGVQVENTYRIREKHPLPTPSSDTSSFYGRPDLQYLLEDYTKFATLEEVMKEYVSDVRLRRQSDKFYYRVRDSRINLFFEDDPLLLLDGVPVFDVDKLMQLDPAKMKKIDVLTRKYYTGPLQNDGIISYRSVEGDLAGYALDPNAVVLEYNGLQQQREFYTPIYDSKARVESRVPDLRNQLQWSPAIRTGTDGTGALSINTSDRAGRYALVIQGTGGNGLAGATVLTFTVTQ